MFCDKCGESFTDDSQFCTKCGNDVTQTKHQTSETPSLQQQSQQSNFKSTSTSKLTIYLIFISIILLVVGFLLIKPNIFKSTDNSESTYDTITDNDILQEGILDDDTVQEIEEDYGNWEYIDGNILNLYQSSNDLINPWYSESLYSKFIFSSILQASADLTEFNPCLAESYKVSNDGLTYTITLRSDLSWSDGTALTVDDLAYNIEIFSENIDYSTLSVIKDAFKYISTVSTEKNNLIITLTEPYYLFDFALSQFVPLPNHILENVNLGDSRLLDNFLDNPLCNGMYMIDNTKPDDNLKLVLNPYYHNDSSDIEMIIFSNDLDSSLDFYNTNTFDEILTYRSIKNFDEYDVFSDFYFYFVFNLSKAFDSFDNTNNNESNYAMQDFRVRQAISLALNREQLLNEIYWGTCSYDYSSTVNDEYALFLSEYNTEKARQLLDEAGYDFNRPLTIAHYHSDEQSLKFLDSVKTSLENVGFIINLYQVSGIVSMYEQPAYDLLLKGYSSNHIYNWFSEYHSNTSFLTNILNINNFDLLYDNLLASSSSSEYNKTLQELQALDMNTIYKIPLYRKLDFVYINNERLSVPENMVFGNLRYRSDLNLAQWSIKKEEVLLDEPEIFIENSSDSVNAGNNNDLSALVDTFKNSIKVE